MDLLFPLEKNNSGDAVVTNGERKEIIENIKRVVQVSVRKVLSGDVDIGEFIMTRVVKFSFVVLITRDFGWGRMLGIIRGSRLISLSSTRFVREILGGCLRTGSGIQLRRSI